MIRSTFVTTALMLHALAFAQTPSQDYASEYDLCAEKRTTERLACVEESEHDTAGCEARVNERFDCELYILHIFINSTENSIYKFTT